MANRNQKALAKIHRKASKGTAVNSSKAREAAGKKPWKGAGDVLGRNR